MLILNAVYFNCIKTVILNWAQWKGVLFSQVFKICSCLLKSEREQKKTGIFVFRDEEKPAIYHRIFG